MRFCLRAAALIALLLFVPLTAAAQYTSYFQGDQVTVSAVEVGARLAVVYNAPWSIPAGGDEYIWHGWLEATPGQLTLRFDVIYSGSHGIAHLVGPAPREWREGKTFLWHPGLGCYARLYPRPDDPTRLGLEAVAVHVAQGGAMLFDAGLAYSGWWDVDAEHWLIEWEIAPMGMMVRTWEEVPAHE